MKYAIYLRQGDDDEAGAAVQEYRFDNLEDARAFAYLAAKGWSPYGQPLTITLTVP